MFSTPETERTSVIRDLGALGGSALRMDWYVIAVVVSSLRMLGTASKSRREFKIPSSALVLYNLFRSPKI